MCKFNAWTVVKSVVFVSGVALCVACVMKAMKEGEKVEIGGQTFSIHGADAKQFIEDVMTRTEL